MYIPIVKYVYIGSQVGTYVYIAWSIILNSDQKITRSMNCLFCGVTNQTVFKLFEIFIAMRKFSNFVNYSSIRNLKKFFFSNLT